MKKYISIFSIKVAIISLLLGGFWGTVGFQDTAYAGCTDTATSHVNWRRCLFDGRNLNNTDLSTAQIRGASFLRATLKDANLSRVDGFRSKFINAELSGAIFNEAKLSEADFTKANLERVQFVGANLRLARFVNANLKGANFSGAELGGASFRGAELEGAIWTDGVKICASESVGICR